MPVLKRRTRTVIFRLTEDEYQDLKSALVIQGARNVSDFARTELLKAVARERLEVAHKLENIESGVMRLEKMLSRITTNGSDE